ncbi:hypothetical protein GFO_3138 [Christiangramia forsetii KT0803]|uniref:Uncharacterized protein n=1 Tax=Christiangramia forsetii (strain DSM 17595 / CGMCC 1.15422 / KT0803) TaxID=411154 RepID=A0M636_CHRFK|nr:hypothetical protein GFO_3138 [Christiangramia forsetii KT0803]
MQLNFKMQKYNYIIQSRRMEQKHYGLKNLVLDGENQLDFLIGRLYDSILKTYA